jgi:NADH:ubiquinone oxidoreductase subunit K
MFFPFSIKFLTFLSEFRDMCFISVSLCGIFVGFGMLLTNVRDYFRLFFATELIFANLTVLFVFCGNLYGNSSYLLLAIVLITLAAVEAAIILSLIVGVHFGYKKISTEHPFYFKGV